MYIHTDFETIPDAFSKYAPETNKEGGHAVVSFPFAVEGIEEARPYVHIALIDPDSIPVAGFAWIHWCAANIPVSGCRTAFPEDFSRKMPELCPQALQGKNSLASKFVGEASSPASQLYIGPTPPDKSHRYLLRAWSTKESLRLSPGFYLSDMFSELIEKGSAADLSSTRAVPQASKLLLGRS